MSNELVKVEEYSFTRADDDVREAMAENLGGQRIDAFNLDRVTIPAGGGSAWEVPTIDGPTPEKVIRGVIIHWQDQRTYWASSLNDGGAEGPPDCFSSDNMTGIGTPGGNCSACALAEFGSAKGGQGAGQACSQKRLLYVLRENDLLPLVVTLPPTSLQPVKKFFMRCASQGLPFWKLEVLLGLESHTSKSGMKFSRVTIAKSRQLSPEACVGVKAYRTKFSGAFSSANQISEAPGTV